MSETILVADENTQFLDQARFVLEQHEYTFLQAINGEDAKLKLEEDDIDLFFVNAALPLIDGFELCRFVKEELRRPIATTLMFSQGSPLPDPEQTAIADNFLVRPIRPKDLLSVVQSASTIAKLLRQNYQLQRQLAEGSSPPQQAPQTPLPPTSQKKTDQEEIDSPLYSMTWFRRLAALEVKRAIRFHQPLSLLLLSYDLTDEHREILDQETLEQLSNTLAFAVRNVIRDIDIPVQFSREHILILLPSTGIEGAIQAATRIQKAVTELLHQEFSHFQPPTISIGATTSSTQGTFKFTDLLKDATRALREVRSQGGNGVFYC